MGPDIVNFAGELNGESPTFSLLENALGADVTSANDAIVFANLPVGQQATIDGRPATFTEGSPVASLVLGTNDRDGNFRLGDDTEIGGDDPNGNNNVFFGITSVNAKALDSISGDREDVDAQITFHSDVNFDFDPADGITGGAFDFVGIATHEIGHALGVISGVDLVNTFTGDGPSNDTDINGGNDGIGELDRFALFSTFDLYRRSQTVFDLNPDALDHSTSNDVFFSIDGNLNDGNDLPLETGTFNGTSHQASHLSDNRGSGILDPTAAPNELLRITDNDILLLDVIGFDVIGADVTLANTAIPEPGSFTLFSVIGLALLPRRR